MSKRAAFETSDYDARRDEAAIAALEPPYASALEVGCSVGVLTQRLAERCDRLLAIDVGEIAGQWPDGAFDLIVCWELLSHLDPPALTTALAAIERTLVPGGSLLAVHSRHPAERQVHSALATTLGWPKAVSVTTPHYLLARFDRP